MVRARRHAGHIGQRQRALRLVEGRAGRVALEHPRELAQRIANLTPLTTVGGYLELLKLSAGGRLNALEMEYVDQAHGATLSLLEMVSTILDMSRLETVGLPLKIRSCDLRTLAQEAVASLGQLARRHRFSLDLPARALMVTCDAELIRRTLGHTGGNRTHSALLLGIGVRTLQRKIRTYAIEIPSTRRRPRGATER